MRKYVLAATMRANQGSRASAHGTRLCASSSNCQHDVHIQSKPYELHLCIMWQGRQMGGAAFQFQCSPKRSEADRAHKLPANLGRGPSVEDKV